MGDKRIYWSDGIERRKQIAEWTLEEITRDGKSSNLNFIRNILIEKDFRRALKEFKSLIASLTNTTLFYLVDTHNAKRFGVVVWHDLFNRVLRPRTTLTKSRIKKGKRMELEKVAELKEDIKEVKPLGDRIFGINKQGERELAVLDTVIYKEVNTVRLRSVKTGKILKDTRTFEERKK